MMRFVLLIALMSCSKADSTKSEPGPGVTPKAPEIKIALAGVTLAEDCADGIPTKPLAPPQTNTTPPPAGASAGSSSEPAAAVARESVAVGACPPGVHCGGPTPPACEQTAMQVSVQVPEGVTATKIKIKQVELLDAAGNTVATLTARAASKWSGTAYVAWDESITGKGDLVASYKLTAPDWNKLTGGRWQAASKRFSLRVTVSISDKDRTIEKQSIVPTTPEPAVAT